MITKNLSKNFFISFLIILIIFLIDRFSKLFVIKLDSQNHSSEIFLSKFLNIQLIWNEGVAFGLLSFEDGKLYNIITVFILLVILVIFFMIVKSNGVKKYSLLMIVGGALGNFYDRVLNKAVPDFIDFHIGNFHWFIFNIADIFITIGVIFMILMEFIEVKKDKNT